MPIMLDEDCPEMSFECALRFRWVNPVPTKQRQTDTKAPILYSYESAGLNPGTPAGSEIPSLLRFRPRTAKAVLKGGFLRFQTETATLGLGLTF